MRTRSARGLLLLAALVLLGACQTSTLRTYAPDRTGATAAINTALRQKGPTSILLKLRPELTEPPAGEWKEANYASARDLVAGLVVLGTGEGWTATPFPPTAEGRAQANAYANEKPNCRVIVKTASPKPNLSEQAQQQAPQYAWRWRQGYALRTAVFDTGLCMSELEGACISFADIRSVYSLAATAGVQKFYPPTREGVTAAIADLIGKSNAIVGIEMRAPLSSVTRQAFLGAVSVLEDTRICGETSLWPAASAERCYDFAEITSLEVSDGQRTAGETLGDIVTLPFRVIGGAAGAIAIGGN